MTALIVGIFFVLASTDAWSVGYSGYGYGGLGLYGYGLRPVARKCLNAEGEESDCSVDLSLTNANDLPEVEISEDTDGEIIRVPAYGYGLGLGYGLGYPARRLWKRSTPSVYGSYGLPGYGYGYGLSPYGYLSYPAPAAEEEAETEAEAEAPAEEEEPAAEAETETAPWKILPYTGYGYGGLGYGYGGLGYGYGGLGYSGLGYRRWKRSTPGLYGGYGLPGYRGYGYGLSPYGVISPPASVSIKCLDVNGEEIDCAETYPSIAVPVEEEEPAEEAPEAPAAEEEEAAATPADTAEIAPLKALPYAGYGYGGLGYGGLGYGYGGLGYSGLGYRRWKRSLPGLYGYGGYGYGYGYGLGPYGYIHPSFLGKCFNYKGESVDC